MLPCLLDQTPDDETSASVSDDGSYDTKSYHEVGHYTARAQAIISLRKMRNRGRCNVPEPLAETPSWTRRDASRRAGLAGQYEKMLLTHRRSSLTFALLHVVR